MIPSHQRRRTVAALGACLVGLAIAIVLITNAGEEPAEAALASADASRSAAGSLPQAPGAADGEQGAGDEERAIHDEERRPSDEERGPSDEERGSTTEHADAGEEAQERGAHGAEGRVREDGTPYDRPRPLGSLDKDSIQEAMRAVKPLLRACFDEALKHDPSVAGRVRVAFEIAASDDDEERGVVKQGSVVDSDTHSPFFEACVLQKVAGLEMPVPEGGGIVTVTYPFHFDPGGGFGGETPPNAPAHDDEP